MKEINLIEILRKHGLGSRDGLRDEGKLVKPDIQAAIQGIPEMETLLINFEGVEVLAHSFADEIIASIVSNNWGTMGLLSFNNIKEIPQEWISQILNNWSQRIENGKFDSGLVFYFRYYFTLIYRYEELFGKYQRLKNFFDHVLSTSTTYRNKPIIEAMDEAVIESEHNQLKLFWEELKKRYPPPH